MVMEMQRPISIHIDVVNDPALVSVVRMVIAAVLEEMGTSRQSVDNAVLLAGEACGNVVRHAYDEPSLYEVGLDVDDAFMDFQVLDYGRGFETFAKSVPGHFGISIMSSIDPNLHIKSNLGDGTMVSAHIPIGNRG